MSFTSTSCALQSFWNFRSPAGISNACVRACEEALSKVTRVFQAGSWPWFGAADAMDDLMPWGRGTFASRPSGDPPGNGLPPLPDPSRPMAFHHLPVLLREVVQYLEPK